MRNDVVSAQRHAILQKMDTSDTSVVHVEAVPIVLSPVDNSMNPDGGETSTVSDAGNGDGYRASSSDGDGVGDFGDGDDVANIGGDDGNGSGIDAVDDAESGDGHGCADDGGDDGADGASSFKIHIDGVDKFATSKTLTKDFARNKIFATHVRKVCCGGRFKNQ
jgi:hypothetical protein